MSAIEFEPFPEIPRLNRTITVTEKIDGTNAAILIVPLEEIEHTTTVDDDGRQVHTYEGPRAIVSVNLGEGGLFAVFAQSRRRLITPKDDNYGFAGWVERNAEQLVLALGAGRHFGEWWGAGIQRKYGLTGPDKRFSLFNTGRWDQFEAFEGVPGLGVVPVLYEGPYSQARIEGAENALRSFGSVAAPGFRNPEGIVIYHHALRSQFKITLEGDEAPKGADGHALDEERSAA
jgi:hypothetical protein